MSAGEVSSPSPAPWAQRPDETKVADALALVTKTRELLQSNLRGLLEEAKDLMPRKGGPTSLAFYPASCSSLR